MHAYPHGNVFYRKLTKSLPRIVRGEGCWFEDADGKRYLDACGGAFVACLGHGNAEIAATLHLSVATVKGHVSRLLDKLEVDNRVQIALLVQAAGEH